MVKGRTKKVDRHEGGKEGQRKRQASMVKGRTKKVDRQEGGKEAQRNRNGKKVGKVS